MTKEMHEAPTVPPQAPMQPPAPVSPAAKPASGLSIASLVMGIVSLTGPGLFLGIPAIITGAMALKRKEGGHGLSVTGLVTGIVSTVLSLLFVLFLIVVIIIGANTPSNQYRSKDSLESIMERSRI